MIAHLVGIIEFFVAVIQSKRTFGAFGTFTFYDVPNAPNVRAYQTYQTILYI